MKTTRTVVLKLQPTADQTVELDATLAAFATACDYIADVARQEHTTNKVLIQRVCYREVRATFGLSANLAIRAIARVCAAEPDDFLGVDLGIAQIATTSDEPKGHCGKPVEKVRRKHNLQRKRLQRKATKGAKKKLVRMSGKEARFRRHENHCISKTIVQTAKDTGHGIALENLKGIRNRITARSGDARNRLSAWSFHQLVGFLSYKVQGRGNPRRAG